MPIMTVEHLSKIFYQGMWPFTKRKEFVAVNDVSFELKQGEILGFLGHNGAGKTTTIQMLLGILTPSSGSINYFGKDFGTNRIDILKRVSTASGFDKLPARLTVWENLDVIGRIYNMPHGQRQAQLEKLLKFFDMWDMRNKETGSLSSGQSTRVMLVKAFLSNPEILLLDEPTAALDPHTANEVRSFILQARKERGVSVLFTSHNMKEVTTICDRVLVLKDGGIIANATPEQLAATVSRTHLNVVITDGLDRLVQLLQELNLSFKRQEHDIEISIDEHVIAGFLATLAEHKIMYSQISIDKPTLEDYFLTLAKK
jgi:ABC-2 type transport system ATP-binding protein